MQIKWKARMRTGYGLMRETFSKWSADKSSIWAAALSYYTIFSLAPLLIIAIAIAGFVFGEEAARGQIVGQIQSLIGREGASMVQLTIENAAKPGTGKGIFATLASLLVLLFGASGVFAQLQFALNTIWGVPETQDNTIKDTIKKRSLAFAMVLTVGFLLLVSLVISAALAAVSGYLAQVLPGMNLLTQLFNFLISWGFITLLFAMIYRILPDVEIAWNDVWVGAAATALLFGLGKYLIGLYLGNSTMGSAYGAAGSLVVLLAWIYYSALILFLGAEFTEVYARRHGSWVADRGTGATQTTARAQRVQAIERRKKAKEAQKCAEDHPAIGVRPELVNRRVGS